MRRPQSCLMSCFPHIYLRDPLKLPVIIYLPRRRLRCWRYVQNNESLHWTSNAETAFNQKLRVEWSVAIDGSAWLVIEWAGTRPPPPPQSPGRTLAPSDTTSAAWEISQRGYDCPAINAPHPHWDNGPDKTTQNLHSPQRGLFTRAVCWI